MDKENSNLEGREYAFNSNNPNAKLYEKQQFYLMKKEKLRLTPKTEVLKLPTALKKAYFGESLAIKFTKENKFSFR